jgi:hypothetical protein
MHYVVLLWNSDFARLKTVCVCRGNAFFSIYGFLSALATEPWDLIFGKSRLPLGT